MFDDLVALFSGWYETYVSTIKNLLVVTNTTTDTVNNTVTIETVVPEIWSAYVPWEQLIAAVVLIVFVCVAFKFLRSVLCKML